MKSKYNINGKTISILSITSALFLTVGVLFFRDLFVLYGKEIEFLLLLTNGTVYGMTYVNPFILSKYVTFGSLLKLRETHEKLYKEYGTYLIKNCAICLVYFFTAFYLISQYAASSINPQYLLIETLAVVVFLGYIRFVIIRKQDLKKFSELLEKVDKALGEKNVK